MRLMSSQNPPCASAERSRLTQVASCPIIASLLILALLALIGVDICVLALLAFLGSLVILTDDSLETKPHMVPFQ